MTCRSCPPPPRSASVSPYLPKYSKDGTSRSPTDSGRLAGTPFRSPFSANLFRHAENSGWYRWCRQTFPPPSTRSGFRPFYGRNQDYLLCENTYKVMRKIPFSHLITTVMNIGDGRDEHRYRPMQHAFSRHSQITNILLPYTEYL